eukprot:973775-Lingulodinium_polyedra.AAC.1
MVAVAKTWEWIGTDWRWTSTESPTTWWHADGTEAPEPTATEPERPSTASSSAGPATAAAPTSAVEVAAGVEDDPWADVVSWTTA